MLFFLLYLFCILHNQVAARLENLLMVSSHLPAQIVFEMHFYSLIIMFSICAKLINSIQSRLTRQTSA